jgi:pyrroloquinoline quinone (PQQ) biosynthesis protein C
MKPMVDENLSAKLILRLGVIQILQGKVERLIADSPFFAAWEPGRVTKLVAGSFLLTFNNLVGSFPPIIAFATSRLGEAARVVLAKNLFEECGEGDAARTHHAIYRNFLRGAGLSADATPMDEHTERWKTFQWNYISVSRPAELVGFIAAGEVLAHPALSRIFEPMQALYPDTDIEYFTTHLAQEVQHVNELATLIAAECDDAESFDRMIHGFDQGLLNWDYWFRAMARVHLERSGAQGSGSPGFQSDEVKYASANHSPTVSSTSAADLSNTK